VNIIQNDLLFCLLTMSILNYLFIVLLYYLLIYYYYYYYLSFL